MRVFLRPVTPPQRFEADPPLSPPTGNGGSHPEASPFRELLTEFRSLTERYGQALLALGEARGEVAALRSRVDLLEARMDMRLPLRPASTVAWELTERPSPPAEASTEAPAWTDAPTEPATTTEAAPEAAAEGVEAPMPEPELQAQPEAVPEPEPEPEAPSVLDVAGSEVEPSEPMAEPPPPPGKPPVSEVPVRVDLPAPTAADEPAERPPEPKRRVTGGRAAVAGLAEALARAEDPTLSDLPGAREAVDALAALQRDMRRAEPVAEEPVAEEPAEEPAEGPVDVGTTEMSEAPVLPEAHEVVEEASAPEEEAPAAPVDSPYTTEVVEPDWFADGDFNWLDAGDGEAEAEAEPADSAPEEPASDEVEHLERQGEAPAVDAIQDAFDEPAPAAEETNTVGFGLFRGQPTSAQAAPTEPAVAPDRPTSAREEEALLWFGDEFEAAHMEVAAEGWRDQQPAPELPAGPAAAVSNAELERIAADEGWDTEEVDAIRSYLGRTAGQVADESTTPPAPPAASAEAVPEAAPGAVPEAAGPPSPVESPAMEPPTPTEPLPADDPQAAPGFSPDQDWLRSRRGPAAGAYRRLRRLFDS
jgi:nicotinate-nucleotide--dimethylbenzimidazole phosphoribosyltransferase